MEEELKKIWKALGHGDLECPHPIPCMRSVPSTSSWWHDLSYGAFPKRSQGTQKHFCTQEGETMLQP